MYALVYASPLQEYYIRETHSRASSKKKNEEAELAESLVGETDNGLIDPSTHSTSSKFPRISRAPSHTVHTRNCGRTCLFLSTTRSRTMVCFGPLFCLFFFESTSSMRSGHTSDIVITDPQSRALMQDELYLSDNELDNELRAVRDIRK